MLQLPSPEQMKEIYDQLGIQPIHGLYFEFDDQSYQVVGACLVGALFLNNGCDPYHNSGLFAGSGLPIGTRFAVICGYEDGILSNSRREGMNDWYNDAYTIGAYLAQARSDDR